VRPEPKTPAEIKAEIAFLKKKLNGKLDNAIQNRIEQLRKRLKDV